MASLITSTAYARLTAPDLGEMRAFLEDFGLVFVQADTQRLYMRGTGDAAFIHVTERGAPGVIGFGYNVTDESVLRQVVAAGLAKSVETINEPGGGRRAILHDPNGLSVELVCGRMPVACLPARPVVRAANGASMLEGPSRVRRFAHCAIATPMARETIGWFQDTLRVIPTDELFVGTPDHFLGQFNRIDLGNQHADHHVLFVFTGPVAGIHHVSFEVESPDEIFVGNSHLDRQGCYDHVRGIGRHALGAQLFDHWMSPFNQMHEHWYSSERMTARSAFNHIRINEGMSHDYGEKPPARFVSQATPLVLRD